MLVDPSVGKALQRERFVRVQDRMLMKLGTATLGHAPGSGKPGAALGRFYVEPWADHHHEVAASVISLAYGEHVDSQINDQYRTVAGARRFIYNIVQFPGCGTFFQAGLVRGLRSGDRLSGGDCAGEFCRQRCRPHHAALRDAAG